MGEGRLFAEAEGRGVDPQKPQQRPGTGKAALDDEARNPIRVGGRQFDRGGAAQRTAHENHRSGEPVPGEPGRDERKDRMRVLHHRADRGVSRRAAVAAVVRSEEVDLHAVEKRSDLVVVGSDLAVAVKKEDIGMRSAAQCKRAPTAMLLTGIRTSFTPGTFVAFSGAVPRCGHAPAMGERGTSGSRGGPERKNQGHLFPILDQCPINELMNDAGNKCLIRQPFPDGPALQFGKVSC